VYIKRRLEGKEFKKIPEETVLGALTKFITTDNIDFQPMNANFGILPPPDRIIRDKAERKRFQAERSLEKLQTFLKEI